jgi:Tfp pilus assembly protein PilF
MQHRLLLPIFVVQCALAGGLQCLAAQAAEPVANTAAPVIDSSAARRFLQGVKLMDGHQDAAALASFTALTQDFPELPDPWNNIALLHARAGQLELARQALETALRNDPSHRTARINLGHVHLLLAVQAWDQAASAGVLDPTLKNTLEAARRLSAAVAR